MRAKPGNLSKLDKYFTEGKNFEFTKEEYEKITGGILSKDLNYIQKKSALSMKAKENGFIIEIKPVEVNPMKICFKKSEE